MEVTKSEFARMCGVTKMAITQKCNRGPNRLVVNSAGLLDTDNKINRAYLDRKTGAFQKQIEADAAGLPVPGANNIASQDQLLPGAEAASSERIMRAGVIMPWQLKKMTLGEILVKFGNVDNAERYIKMMKDITMADEKEFGIRVKRQDFIKKDFVTAKVFVFIDQLMNQLLDMPESVADQVISLALSGDASAKKEIISMIREKLSRCISGAKDSILHEFAGLKASGADPESDALANIQEQLEELKSGNGS